MKKEDFFLDPGKVLIATFATLKCTEFLTTVIPQNYQANRKLICFTHLIMSLGEKVSPVPLPSSQEKRDYLEEMDRCCFFNDIEKQIFFYLIKIRRF